MRPGRPKYGRTKKEREIIEKAILICNTLNILVLANFIGYYNHQSNERLKSLESTEEFIMGNFEVANPDIKITADSNEVLIFDNKGYKSDPNLMFITVDVNNPIEEIVDTSAVGYSEVEIRRAGEAGAICEVYGHQWRGGRPGEEDGIYADYHPYTNYRTCKICGKCEEQNMSWE